MIAQSHPPPRTHHAPRTPPHPSAPHHHRCIRPLHSRPLNPVAAPAPIHHAVVVDPADYPALLEQLSSGAAADGLAFRKRMAWKAFQHTASYDATVAEWLWGQVGELRGGCLRAAAASGWGVQEQFVALVRRGQCNGRGQIGQGLVGAAWVAAEVQDLRCSCLTR